MRALMGEESSGKDGGWRSRKVLAEKLGEDYSYPGYEKKEVLAELDRPCR